MSEFKISNGAPLFVHIAAGVAIGVVVAAAVIWASWLLQLRYAQEEAAKQVQQATARIAAQQRQHEQAARDSAQQLRAAEASAQRAAEDLKRRVADEARKKELAWSRFYTKPAKCDDSRGGSWSVDCANEYIRAKRLFEEQYSAGKL